MTALEYLIQRQKGEFYVDAFVDLVPYLVEDGYLQNFGTSMVLKTIRYNDRYLYVGDVISYE